MCTRTIGEHGTWEAGDVTNTGARELGMEVWKCLRSDTGHLINLLNMNVMLLYCHGRTRKRDVYNKELKMVVIWFAELVRMD
jgi:hypothetical protein